MKIYSRFFSEYLCSLNHKRNSKMKYLLLLVFAVCLFSCAAPTEPAQKAEEKKETVEAAVEVPDFFKKILDAHGGLNKWDTQKSLIFEKGDKHLVDLKTRNELIEKPGKYTLGFNGDQMWISPSRDSFPGKAPRFYRNLHFYFFGLPFLLADPGVNLEDMGTKTFDDNTYNVTKATFGAGVGDAPEDQYILYTNPETNQLEFINYSVTYYDKSRATSYNALVYEWQEVGELTVPKGYKGYKWENEMLGELRYEIDINKVVFSKNAPDASAFAAPEGAWTEK